MAMFVERRTLDLQKVKGETRRIAPIRLREDEKGLTEIEAHITDDGEPFNLTDMYVRFAYINPYGGRFFRDAEITDAENGVVTYTVDEDLTKESGYVNVSYFEVSTPAGDVSTDRLPILILPSADLTEDDKVRYKNDLDKLREQYEKLVEDIYNTLEEIIEAEADRKANEETREENEDQREENEAAREAAEAQRKANEEARQTAEAQRQENESERIANEEARQTAETSRANEFTRLKSESEKATKAANDAATNTNATNEKVKKAEAERVANEAERVEFYEGIKADVAAGLFDGARGSLWYVGTEVNKAGGDVDGSVDNDCYLNRDTADVFHKVNGLWVYQLTLSGGGGGGEIEMRINVAVAITTEPADGHAYKAGEKVGFEVSIFNDSLVTVYDLKTQVSPGVFTDSGKPEIVVDEIKPANTAKLAGTYTVKESDYGKTIKLHVISGNTLVQQSAYSSDITFPERSVAMGVTKTITTTGTGDDGEYYVGDEVGFNIAVRNTGNITLTNVVVTEQLPECKIQDGTGYTVTNGTAKITSIAPAATANVKALYTIPDTDQGRDGITNTVNVTATETTGSATSPAFNVSNQVMTLEAQKAITSTGTGSGGAYTSGDTIKYSVTVHNTGEREYDNVEVTDKLAGCTFTAGDKYTANGQTATISHIGAQETITLTAQRPVAETDMGQFGVINTVDVKAGSSVVSAESASAAFEALRKTMTGTVTIEGTNSGANGAFVVGETVQYRVSVTNTGNVDITKITVTSDK